MRTFEITYNEGEEGNPTAWFEGHTEAEALQQYEEWRCGCDDIKFVSIAEVVPFADQTSEVLGFIRGVDFQIIIARRSEDDLRAMATSLVEEIAEYTGGAQNVSLDAVMAALRQWPLL